MDLLTTAEAAELLGCTEDTLRKRRQREREHPRHVKYGSVVLYRRASVMRYLATAGRR